MEAAVQPASKVLAASYAHNQQYYNQPAWRTTGQKRVFQLHPPSDPFLRRAAAEVSGILKWAQSLASSAQNLSKPDNSSFRSPQVKKMVEDYNELIGGLSVSGTPLHPWVKRGLENAVSGYGSVGLHKKQDGTLQLDETKFEDSLQARSRLTRQVFTGPQGIAGKLAQAAERIGREPPSSLLDPQAREYRRYSVYQSSAGFYLQMPIKGLLYDSTF
jgi:hypothetical protein